MRPIVFISLPLYALDQITKHLVLRHLALNDAHVVIPGWFELVHVTNDGAAFGSFKNNNAFFIALSIAALLFVSYLLIKPHRREFWRELSLSLLLAGVLGNLTDRLLHGHVIDFLLFDLHVPFANPFPAFNVADSCICIAVVCFIIQSIRESREAPAAT